MATVTGFVLVAALFGVKGGVAKEASDLMCTSKVLFGFYIYLLAAIALGLVGGFFYHYLSVGGSETKPGE